MLQVRQSSTSSFAITTTNLMHIEFCNHNYANQYTSSFSITTSSPDFIPNLTSLLLNF